MGAIRTESVLIRVDGSDRIGSGHQRRCLSVANILAAWGITVTFICARHSGNFNADILASRHELLEIDGSHLSEPEQLASPEVQNKDMELCLKAFGGQANFDAIVIDHYQLGEMWEKQARNMTARIVVIDDLFNRKHEADVLLDASPGPEERYGKLLPRDCEMLLGPKYALIRPEFTREKEGAKLAPERIKTVLISFGATDPCDYTSLSVQAARSALGKDIAIFAVIGRAYKHETSLAEMARKDSRLVINVDCDSMSHLMNEADIAIGGGGTTSWERACAGLPSLVTSLADNQETTIKALEALGCAIRIPTGDLFKDQLQDKLLFLNQSPALRQLMGNAGQMAVDGRGAIRTARRICIPQIIVRKAEIEDSSLIWEWRNSATVRETAADSREIPYKDHKKWFERCLQDPDICFLIGEIGGEPVGVVRFNLEEETAIVSIFLKPGIGGQGIGDILIDQAHRWLRKSWPSVSTITAHVLPGNRASIAFFGAADYVPSLLTLERIFSDD